MAEKFSYRVLREMHGDRPYAAGDRRDLTEADAAHLVALGVLSKIGPAKADKAAPKAKAKAVTIARNKADRPLKNKES